MLVYISSAPNMARFLKNMIMSTEEAALAGSACTRFAGPQHGGGPVHLNLTASVNESTDTQ